VLARYNTVFNGFAARLTNAEVITLKSNANVVDVFEDLPLQLQTVSTPKFLGLTSTGACGLKLRGLSRQGREHGVGHHR